MVGSIIVRIIVVGISIIVGIVVIVLIIVVSPISTIAIIGTVVVVAIVISSGPTILYHVAFLSTMMTITAK